MSAVDLPSCLGVERVVRGVHVCEEGVTAEGWDGHGVQDRSHRRTLSPGHVVVPGVFVSTLLLVLGESHELGLGGVWRQEGVLLQLAKAAGEGDVLLRGHGLVAEEDHLVLVKGPTDLLDRCGAEISREVDARELGADRRAQLCRVEVVPLEAGKAVSFSDQVEVGPHDQRIFAEPRELGTDARLLGAPGTLDEGAGLCHRGQRSVVE